MQKPETSFCPAGGVVPSLQLSGRPKAASKLSRSHEKALPPPGGGAALRRLSKSLRRPKAPHGNLRPRGARIRVLTARPPPPQNNQPPAGFEPLLSPIAGYCANRWNDQASGGYVSKLYGGRTSHRKRFTKCEQGECTDSPLSNVQKPNHLGFHCKTCMQRYRVTDD